MDSRLLAEVRQRNRVHPRLPPRQLHSSAEPMSSTRLRHQRGRVWAAACRLLTWQLH